MGHQNKSKNNTYSNKTSSKIPAKASDTQTELYEQNTDQHYQSSWITQTSSKNT